MKRQLSLVLALVMILGSFSSVFAAVSVDQSAVNVAGAFLKAEGVLEGDDGNLMLNANLKRRDAVVLLSRLYGEEDLAQNFPSEDLKFTDITDDHYNGYIAWSVDKEIIEGHTGTTLFGFNEEITSQDFATVVLRVLGYTVDEAAYPKALELAEELGLLIDIEGVENKTVVTRGMMALMTLNAMYVEVKGEKVTLAEKLGIKNLPEREEEKADKLEAKVLDTENLAEVVVELSNVDLVKSKDALLNPDNYRLEKTDAKVQHVHLDGDNLILTLVPYGKVKEQPTFKVLAKGKTFDLTIRNIDNAINKTYKNIVAGDNEIIEVTNVDFMGDYGIKVTTSEPIANPLERNFRIDARTSMIVEQYGRDIILTPYHNRAFDKDAVTLTIDKLEDFAGYTTVKEDHSMKLSTDDALPTVERVYRSGAKLVVEFDRDVYEDSVKAYENRRNLGNVSFSERRVEFYAEKAEKVDTNVVEYTFSRDIPRGVEVVIVDVANHFNKAMDKYVGVPAEYRDDYAPVILSSTANVELSASSDSTYKTATDGFTKLQLDNWKKNTLVNTASMTIVFDKDIKEFETLKAADVKVEDYFTLYELDITRRGEDAAKNVKIKVEEVKKDRIVLSFEDIRLNNSDRDYDYILEVRDLSDMNRNRMERDYRDFQVVPVSSKFNVTSLDYKDSTYFNRPGVELTLKFNKYVDVDEASNPRNYYLDGKLSFDEAIVERDGVTVSLIIYDTTVAKLLKDNKVLEISPRVTQLSTTNVVVDRFWDIKNKKAIVDKNQADSGAIVYTYATKEVTGTVANKNIADLNEVSISVKGKAGDTVTLLVYKDGALVPGLAQATTITTTDVAQPLTIATQTVAIGEKWEILAEVAGEKESLIVQKLDNDTTVTVGGGFTAGSTTVLPYGTKIANLTFPRDEKDTIASPDITIVPNGTNATFTARLSGNVLIVEVTAEDGTEMSYSYVLDVAIVDASSTISPATATVTNSTNQTITVTLADTATTPGAVKGIADKFVVTHSGAADSTTVTVSAVTETSTPGTYTFTVNNTAIEAVTYTVTVDGVALTGTSVITTN